MIKWSDLSPDKSPEEAVKGFNRKAIGDMVESMTSFYRKFYGKENMVPTTEAEKQYVNLLKLQETFLEDARVCARNHFVAVMTRQQIDRGEARRALKTLETFVPRDEEETNVRNILRQDANDKLIENQSTLAEKLRSRAKPPLTESQESMLREIFDSTQKNTKYTSLVNFGAARHTVETLEAKGLVQIIFSDKMVNTRNAKERRMIDNVVTTDAANEFFSQGE